MLWWFADEDDERTCPKVKDVYITKAVLIKQKGNIYIGTEWNQIFVNQSWLQFHLYIAIQWNENEWKKWWKFVEEEKKNVWSRDVLWRFLWENVDFTGCSKDGFDELWFFVDIEKWWKILSIPISFLK